MCIRDRANTAVYSFALSILKNTSDAEDALHDCFLDIYQAAEHYRPQGKPMAWIFTCLLYTSAQVLEITLYDHIIVAGDDFVSLAQSGIFAAD